MVLGGVEICVVTYPSRDLHHYLGLHADDTDTCVMHCFVALPPSTQTVTGTADVTTSQLPARRNTSCVRVVVVTKVNKKQSATDYGSGSGLCLCAHRPVG